MPEIWSYRLQDFLLFSPRAYWRLFELHNQALWPLHIAAVLIGFGIVALAMSRRDVHRRAAFAALAAVWVWVAWSFLWVRYSTINWAAVYAVPGFVLQGALLIWFGGVRGAWTGGRATGWRARAGWALIAYAFLLHPLMPLLSDRSWRTAEVFAIAPDPTAIVTLGVVALVGRGIAGWILAALPLIWCAISWATLSAMGAPESWIPIGAAALAVAAMATCRQTAR